MPSVLQSAPRVAGSGSHTITNRAPCCSRHHGSPGSGSHTITYLCPPCCSRHHGSAGQDLTPSRTVPSVPAVGTTGRRVRVSHHHVPCPPCCSRHHGSPGQDLTPSRTVPSVLQSAPRVAGSGSHNITYRALRAAVGTTGRRVRISHHHVPCPPCCSRHHGSPGQDLTPSRTVPSVLQSVPRDAGSGSHTITYRALRAAVGTTGRRVQDHTPVARRTRAERDPAARGHVDQPVAGVRGRRTTVRLMIRGVPPAARSAVRSGWVGCQVSSGQVRCQLSSQVRSSVSVCRPSAYHLHRAIQVKSLQIFTETVKYYLLVSSACGIHLINILFRSW